MEKYLLSGVNLGALLSIDVRCSGEMSLVECVALCVCAVNPLVAHWAYVADRNRVRAYRPIVETIMTTGDIGFVFLIMFLERPGFHAVMKSAMSDLRRFTSESDVYDALSLWLKSKVSGLSVRLLFHRFGLPGLLKFFSNVIFD